MLEQKRDEIKMLSFSLFLSLSLSSSTKFFGYEFKLEINSQFQSCQLKYTKKTPGNLSNENGKSFSSSTGTSKNLKTPVLYIRHSLYCNTSLSPLLLLLIRQEHVSYIPSMYVHISRFLQHPLHILFRLHLYRVPRS